MAPPHLLHAGFLSTQLPWGKEGELAGALCAGWLDRASCMPGHQGQAGNCSHAGFRGVYLQSGSDLNSVKPLCLLKKWYRAIVSWNVHFLSQVHEERALGCWCQLSFGLAAFRGSQRTQCAPAAGRLCQRCFWLADTLPLGVNYPNLVANQSHSEGAHSSLAHDSRGLRGRASVQWCFLVRCSSAAAAGLGSRRPGVSTGSFDKIRYA